MVQSYKIPKVSAEVIMEVIEGVCHKNGMTVDDATAYIGKSKEYARRALVVGEQLGMIKNVDSKFEAVSDAKAITWANKEQWPALFGKFLQHFNPLYLFASLLNRGNSLKDSARKIKVIYDIDSNEEIIVTSLVGWGEYAGILKRKNDHVELFIETENLTAEYIRDLLQAMENDIKARIYIANKLGDDVFGYMSPDELDYLVKAIREHQSDPRGAIDDGGRAFEDFLRHIAANKSVPVNNCKGIQEIADAIRGAKLIDTKQLDVCKSANTMRTAAAHSKDRNSGDKWTLNPDASIECILLILTSIRSIHNYVFKSTQMF